MRVKIRKEYIEKHGIKCKCKYTKKLHLKIEKNGFVRTTNVHCHPLERNQESRGNLSATSDKVVQMVNMTWPKLAGISRYIDFTYCFASDSASSLRGFN